MAKRGPTKNEKVANMCGFTAIFFVSTLMVMK